MGKQRTCLQLKIRRSFQWCCQLTKSSDNARVGLDITSSCNESVMIKDIKEGLVRDWNKVHPNLAIEPGDRIVGCCGVSDDTHKVLATIKQSRVLDLVFSRN